MGHFSPDFTQLPPNFGVFHPDFTQLSPNFYPTGGGNLAVSQIIAKLEKDIYRPRNRAFDETKDVRFRVVYSNPITLGLKKESYRTQDEAERRIEELNSATTTTVVYSEWTVAHALELWETRKMVKLKSAKIEAYKVRIIKKHIGHVLLSALMEEHIFKLKKIIEKGRAVRTVNAYLVTLRTALNYAKRKGVIERFPDISEYIETTLETKRDRVATAEEFERLLRACSVKKSGRAREHLYSYLLWLHETGMRTGELKKVQVKDIDLERGLVRVWSGKSKRPVQRECGITPRLRKHILESKILERDPETLIFGEQHRWQRCFNTACRIAKLENFRMHDLRRTAVTNFLEKGIPLHLVAKMVGHSANSVLTLDVYTRFRAEFIQEMMLKMT